MGMTVEPMVCFPVWRHRTFEPKEDVCFVLMPFTRVAQQLVFKNVVKKVLVRAGLQAKREDESHGHDVMEDVWVNLNEARCVLADVTGGNPNVLYEVGIAHALGKPLLLLSADSGRRTPFDISGYRYIFYEVSEKGLRLLRATLAAKVATLLRDYPTGSQLKGQVEDSAAEWTRRMHDHMLLNRVELLNAVRRYVKPAALSDAAIAYALATGAHCCSIDHLAYWGHECSDRPGAAADLAMTVVPRPEGFRRPRLRAARVIEQLGAEAKRHALRRLREHGVEEDLAAAIEAGTVRAFVAVHADDLRLDPQEAKAVLSELDGIVL